MHGVVSLCVCGATCHSPIYPPFLPAGNATIVVLPFVAGGGDDRSCRELRMCGRPTSVTVHFYAKPVSVCVMGAAWNWYRKAGAPYPETQFGLPPSVWKADKCHGPLCR